MNKSIIKPLLYSAGIFAVLVIVTALMLRVSPAVYVTSEAVELDATPVPIEPDQPTAKAAVPVSAPAASGTVSAPSLSTAPTPAPFVPPGYVPLSRSPVAKKWLEEEGITAEDIEVAQDRLRAQGFPAHRLDDPGLVRPFLPRRNVVSVHVKSFEIAERAPAGETVPFRLGGVYPDASFQFVRFEVDVQGEVIRIRPIGHSSGEVAPGVEIPVNLEGALNPLPPGTYRIEFPELGPHGSHTLVIE